MNSVGSVVGPVSAATWSPAASCFNVGGVGGCSGNIETETISASFTFTSPSATTPTTVTVNGVFTAKYVGSHLACDTTGPSNGSDCVIWNGSTNNTGTGYIDVPISFTDGAGLTMRLYNAMDWDITNYVRFTETAAPRDPVPEPASIAMFGIGLLGLGFIRSRKQH